MAYNLASIGVSSLSSPTETTVKPSACRYCSQSNTFLVTAEKERNHNFPFFLNTRHCLHLWHPHATHCCTVPRQYQLLESIAAKNVNVNTTKREDVLQEWHQNIVHFVISAIDVDVRKASIASTLFCCLMRTHAANVLLELAAMPGRSSECLSMEEKKPTWFMNRLCMNRLFVNQFLIIGS